MADYSITQTVPTVYLDKRGIAVNGYTVYINLPEFDEIHSIQVPNLDANGVKTAVDKLLKDRRALASLGQSK
jgi:hypothetical protein